MARRVAIVEDHAALRVFLRDVLTRLGWEVTGIAGTAEAGFELVTSSAPDLAVVDLHLASEGGDTLIRRLADADGETRILVFTATSDPTELQHVLDAGAHGVVLKEGGLAELMDGLETVARGERYFSPTIK